MSGEASTADLTALLSRAGEHRARMSQARAEIGEGIDWYLYDILANFSHLDALLQGEYRDLNRLAAGAPVADVGAADGDLAFALEHEFGWQVDIVDTAETNMNGLAAARALKEHLRSSVEIVDIDLDSQFDLPRQRYGLVLFLGILYHLQNPYYALRHLAGRAEHCIVSTRVARFAGPEPTRIADVPVAYLVNPDETNNDASNYWIFSPAGLDRIVTRAGWSVLATHFAGDTEASDPSSPDHDERAFMLLRSNRQGQ